MSWNYRVIEYVKEIGGDPWRAIHTVFYEDVNGEQIPVSYAEKPAVVLADGDDMQIQMKSTLNQMMAALEKPALVERDFEDGRKKLKGIK